VNQKRFHLQRALLHIPAIPMLVLGFRLLARSSHYVWCSTSQCRNL